MEKKHPNTRHCSVQVTGLHVFRFVSILSLFAVGACSQVPDAANPIEWYKGASSLLDDDESDSSELSVLDPTLLNDQAAVEGETFPNLNDVPERPPAYDPNSNVAIAKGLVADRAHAEYSDETIRLQSQSDRGFTIQAPAPQKTASIDAPSPAAAPRSPVVLAGELTTPDINTVAPPPSPVFSPPSRIRPVIRPAPAALPSAVARSLRIPTSDVVPSLPYFPAGAPQLNQAMSQNFAQSGAAALPANFQAPIAPAADFAPPLAAIPQSGAAKVAVQPSLTPKALLGETALDSNGPRSLAEFDPNASGLSIRVATVYFSIGSHTLDKKSRETLKDVIGMFRQNGTSIRVVGHASSRTRDLDPMLHKLANFNISIDRANTVAKGLMRLGIEPNQVFVGARADSEPVYFEVMPSGEAGNRRTEIYIDY